MAQTKNLPIRNTQKELSLFYKRMLVAVLVIVLMSLALLGRLLYLQIICQDRFVTLSNQNQLGLIPIEPRRGLIFDRNGQILAENLPVFSLDLIPAKVNSLKTTIADLSKIINLSDDDIKLFYHSMEGRKKFQPIPLKFNLSEQEIAKFSVNQWRFPGVTISSRFMRYYPLRDSMVTVLGFMARINQNEAKMLDPVNYSASTEMGKLGIEKHFEALLHGQVGYQQVETDASGRVVRVLNKVPPVSGDTIYLTLDSNLQKIAQAAVADNAGAVVAIAPQTGEVLTMYSNPSYDPNLFVKGISNKDYQALQNEHNRPLYNRAIRGLYAPGSTAKPYMALEALSTNTINTDFAINDPGFFVLGHHLYRDDRKGGHGVVNVVKAITVSCDTFFYTLADKMGIRKIDDVLSRFGFGKPTGIEMDEELGGLVPTPEWKEKVHHKHWYGGDTIVAGIGQGYILETPMQIAEAIATMAMKGQHLQPHLLLKMLTPDGQIIQTKPKLINTIMLPNTAWKAVQNGMIGVIKAPWGTGLRFGRNPPYTVAGKTGTAQVFHSSVRFKENQVPEYLRDNSIFIAYAPVENPQIAVAVVTEHSGSEFAASVARKVIDEYLLKEKHLNS